MSKNKSFPHLPLSGGSKKIDELDIKVIEENLLRFNKPGERRCLSCREKFPSEGAHNQYCKKCKIKYGENLFSHKTYRHQTGIERTDCDKPNSR